jgi:hypothetical protein
MRYSYNTKTYISTHAGLQPLLQMLQPALLLLPPLKLLALSLCAPEQAFLPAAHRAGLRC